MPCFPKKPGMVSFLIAFFVLFLPAANSKGCAKGHHCHTDCHKQTCAGYTCLRKPFWSLILNLNFLRVFLWFCLRNAKWYVIQNIQQFFRVENRDFLVRVTWVVWYTKRRFIIQKYNYFIRCR